MKKMWINIWYDSELGKTTCSEKPYPSKEEAEKGIYMGRGITKVGCIEIDIPINESNA